MQDDETMNDFFLPHYYHIVNKQKVPKAHKSKHVAVNYDVNDPIDKLWKIHDNAVKKDITCRKIPPQSLLDLKIDIADKIFYECSLCEHQCKIDRRKKTGICGVKKPLIASEFVHTGEESCFTPSHTIFFSGCNFHCIFCQNFNISQHINGLYFSPDKIAERIHQRYDEGTLNVNWVGGEPTPNLAYILKTIREVDRPIPQIWNSNMYCSKATMKLLSGVIDVFLTDFKFGNNQCAEQLANAPRYMQIITRNQRIATSVADVFIRHLVMPTHISCCSLPVLTWIANNISTIPIHIMDQYYPAYKAKNIYGLQRRCSKKELQEVFSFAQELQLNLSMNHEI
jgi:putative pyruvate formate lyase activating enzyme